MRHCFLAHSQIHPTLWGFILGLHKLFRFLGVLVYVLFFSYTIFQPLVEERPHKCGSMLTNLS